MSAHQTGSYTPATIATWVAEISTYIKPIDPNRLVAIGNEGFYNQTGGSTYPYQWVALFRLTAQGRSDKSDRGGEGINFATTLNIKTIDFGTLHCQVSSNLCYIRVQSEIFCVSHTLGTRGRLGMNCERGG